ncbi:hypothetical protein [Streptomyces sp. XY58]|uniref:hypothetical protein n=1 Tax=Streptomyces sp. XY58 TaxID=1519482 RepID=UPI00131E3DB7|nr:hypothetical protein [Streptomyces sp. XY58]
MPGASQGVGGVRLADGQARAAALVGVVHWAARGLLTDCLVTGHVHEQVAGGLHRNVGWLSALMGNLAFHLDDHTGARAHLATATAYGTRTRTRTDTHA